MKKNSNILNKIKPIFVATLLLVGFAFVAANSWTAPTANPKIVNTKPPVDQGTLNQEKTGALTVGTLTNLAYAPVVTYGPFYVGILDGSNYQEADTTFYGKLNLIKVMSDAGTYTTAQPLCTNYLGKVKVCSQDVLFEPVQEVYFTTTNVLTYPSGGVTGAVRYKIDSALTCTTISTSGTSWSGGTTLTGSNSNYSVSFNDWGTYILSMSCSVGGSNPKTYSAVISVKGKVVPTAHNSVQKFQFPTARTLDIFAQGGGALAATSSGTCSNGSDGLSSFAHVTSSSSWSPNSYGGSNQGASYNAGANVVQVGGGIAPINWGSSHCGQSYGTEGDGGNVISNNLSVSTVHSGGVPSGGGGGCPGSFLGTSGCSLTEDGSGGTWIYGGGGGAYASGKYNISANNYLYLYQGSGVGSSSTSNNGKQGYIYAEFQ